MTSTEPAADDKDQVDHPLGELLDDGRLWAWANLTVEDARILHGLVGARFLQLGEPAGHRPLTGQDLDELARMHRPAMALSTRNVCRGQGTLTFAGSTNWTAQTDAAARPDRDQDRRSCGMDSRM